VLDALGSAPAAQHLGILIGEVLRTNTVVVSDAQDAPGENHGDGFICSSIRILGRGYRETIVQTIYDVAP